MGKALDGAMEHNTTHCHPQCTLHGPYDSVSKRTYQRCTDRINLSLWRQAALRREETLECSADASTSAASLCPALGAGPSLLDDLAMELEPPLLAHSNPDDQDDTTMPTWGLHLGGNSFECGTGADEISSAGEDDVPAEKLLETESGGVSEAGTRSPTPSYDLAVEWSTDIGYSSGSEADVESEAGTHLELDELFPISPASSRAGSPAFHMEESEDSEPEAPATPDGPMLGDPDPVPPVDPGTPKADTKFPDALHAFREWVLKLTSGGDLTIAAAESFLKTLHMCLEKDLLRCGPNADPGKFYILLKCWSTN
ncbi:hypothetical protein FS749_002643 [Ceratobasidium sp. UAMH 11750]|nr:hypothetical protein FS749_002643 [Ceratobasidium sp. UAMH 11750]